MNEKILAGRYVLVEQIGIGGMAIVYRAIDRNTGHSVAVKVLKPEFNRDAEFVSRFQREAEAASKMTHHNIVNLLDVGMDGENRYLIMEYVKGQTLKEVIQEKGRLSADALEQAKEDLEKSIVANLADDVVVGVKGDRIELVITKRFK